MKHLCKKCFNYCNIELSKCKSKDKYAFKLKQYLNL